MQTTEPGRKSPLGRIVAAAAIVALALLAIWAMKSPPAPDVAPPAPPPQVPVAPPPPPPPPPPRPVQPAPTAEPQEARTQRLEFRIEGRGPHRDDPPVPIAGARVTLADGIGVTRVAVSDADGVVVFHSAPKRGCEFVVSAPGYIDARWTATPGTEFGLAPALDRGASIAGVVADAVTGRPVAGAEVILRDAAFLKDAKEWARVWATLRTNELGEFETSAVRPFRRVWVIARTADGLWGRVYASAPASGAPATRADVRVEPCGTLTGHVLTADDKPVPGAFVYAVATDVSELVERIRGGWTPEVEPWSPGLLPARSNDDGRFVVEGLRLGSAYVVAARRARDVFGYRDLPSAPIEGVTCTAEARDVSQDILLRPPGALVVRLVHLPADAERGIEVTGERSAEETADGWRFKFVAPGERRVEVRVAGCATEFRTVNVPPGETRTITIELAAATALEVAVTDDAGHPLAGAAVSVRRADGTGVPSKAETSAEGRVRFDDLRAVPHRVEAESDGLAPAFEVATPGAAPVVLVVRAGGLLKGTITDREDRPLDLGEFVLRGPVERTTSTDTDGAFEIRLPPGRYLALAPDGHPLGSAEVRAGETTETTLRGE